MSKTMAEVLVHPSGQIPAQATGVVNESALRKLDALLAAVEGVLALPHEEYCCTKGVRNG